MKRHSGRTLLIGLLVMVGFVGVAASQQPKLGGTLRVAWEADITGPLYLAWRPSLAYGGPSLQ
jgi:hypothetical protein